MGSLMSFRLVVSALVFPVVLFGGWRSARADAEPTVAELRERVLKADTPEKKAEAYKAYFLKVGRAGLKDLTKDEDTSIAIQAGWESHKLVKREPAVRGRADDIYDPDDLKKFVAFLKERGKVSVPDWWAAAVVVVDVYPGHHHAFVGPADERPGSVQAKMHKAETERRASAVEEKGGDIVYTARGRSISFPKAETHGLFNHPVGVIGEKHSAVLAGPDCRTAGRQFHYELVGFAGRGGKAAWRADVWATAGYNFFGPGDSSLDDLTEQDGVVCVFGMKGFTAWAEAFDVATGAVRFRFSSSYWCHWSEEWGLK
jgi:hypothetical protein